MAMCMGLDTVYDMNPHHDDPEDDAFIQVRAMQVLYQKWPREQTDMMEHACDKTNRPVAAWQRSLMRWCEIYEGSLSVLEIDLQESWHDPWDSGGQAGAFVAM